MLKYNSRRHQRLMDQSEYALSASSVSSSPHVSRIVNNVLQDSRTYGLWESQHADLLLPVAGHTNKKRQIIALRDAEVQLVHRRALFRSLRINKVRGERRRRLFRIFHSSIGYENAVLAEHRQYVLAVTSRVSADHLAGIMHDPNSQSLLRQYERLYSRYFDMKCYVVGMGNSDCIEMIVLSMQEERDQLRRLRQRIGSEPPVAGCGNFDREEAFTLSGHYPMLNYMVG